MERDPVCGMTVDPAKAAALVEHGGKAYYFCAPGCAKQFSANPETYLQRIVTPQTPPAFPIHQAAPPHAQAPNKIRYTCPMHPEVIQFAPGTCPQCGMALEPMDFMANDSAEAADPEYLSMRKRFWVSAALSLPVVLLAMFGEHIALPLSGSARHGLQFALARITQGARGDSPKCRTGSAFD